MLLGSCFVFMLVCFLSICAGNLLCSVDSNSFSLGIVCLNNIGCSKKKKPLICINRTGLELLIFQYTWSCLILKIKIVLQHRKMNGKLCSKQVKEQIQFNGQGCKA